MLQLVLGDGLSDFLVVSSPAPGDSEARARARKYIDLVRAQRVGPVHVDESHDDGDREWCRRRKIMFQLGIP